MSLRITVALCACTLFGHFAQAEEIKVRILKLNSSFQVTGVGLRFSGSQSGMYQSLSLLPTKKTAAINYHDGEWTVSSDAKLITIVGSKLEINGERLAIGRSHLPSTGFFAATDRKSKTPLVDYVARLPIDDYLVDVVASELPFGWPLEAQKAQAVAARSYALSIMNERRKLAFDIDSTTLHQVYQYKRSFKYGSAEMANIREAVGSTHDITLADSKGRLLKSYYHAHCGGQTEESRDVWGVGPKFGVVKDSGCTLSRAGQWSTQIPFSEIIHRLARTRNGPTPVTIQNIEFKYKPDSPRVDEVVITALEGKVKLRSQAFREMFGYDRVKSTLFSAKIENQTLKLEGRGHGHGVGMCQTGARMMALAGASYQDILRHYYPLAQIVKPAPAPIQPEIEMPSQASLIKDRTHIE